MHGTCTIPGCFGNHLNCSYRHESKPYDGLMHIDIDTSRDPVTINVMCTGDDCSYCGGKREYTPNFIDDYDAVTYKDLTARDPQWAPQFWTLSANEYRAILGLPPVITTPIFDELRAKYSEKYRIRCFVIDKWWEVNGKSHRTFSGIGAWSHYGFDDEAGNHHGPETGSFW